MFAKTLLEARRDNAGVKDGTEIFARVREPVRLNAPQVPQYGRIRFAGHELGGDFLFVRREVVLMRWGLIPAWAKKASIGAKLINARAETLAEKPSFRSAFDRRRCLVIADGFYEWKSRAARRKQPFLIRLADAGHPLA